MSDAQEANESKASRLCLSCGLCCTGHLFTWTKPRSAELDAVEALGLKVFRAVPSQRGFNQPCPLWQGQCTIYTSPAYPRFCQTYKCKLLKNVLDETTSFPRALTVIEDAKTRIREVEARLPDSPNPNFRERLVAQLESLETSSHQKDTDVEFLQKADRLLALYADVFGVEDVIEKPDAERMITPGTNRKSNPGAEHEPSH